MAVVTEPPPPSAPAGWYPHPEMVDTQRYWDGEAWTEHIAPTSQPSPVLAGGEGTRPCPYCTQPMGDLSTRCPSCAGELRVCPRCNDLVGMDHSEKFVGLLRGGTKTQYRCMECGKVLDGPRF